MSQLSTFVFARDPRAVRAARRKVRSLNDLPEITRDELELVVSELVTSSLLRAGPGPEVIEMTIRLNHKVAIEVVDPGVHAGLVADGMSARLLDSLCDSWRIEDGKITASISIGHAQLGPSPRQSRAGAVDRLLLEVRGAARGPIMRPMFSRR
jgi:hypothetical protein